MEKAGNSIFTYSNDMLHCVLQALYTSPANHCQPAFLDTRWNVRCRSVGDLYTTVMANGHKSN